MKGVLRFIKTTAMGGIFFILPLAIVIIVFARIFRYIQQLFQPLLNMVEGSVQGIALQKIVALLLLVVLCFVAGLLAKTSMAKRLLVWVENNILRRVPGYSFFKSIGRSMAGIKEQEMKIVLVRVDDGWQIAFLIEQINDNMYTVFVPDAPTPISGSVYHVEKDRIIWTQMTRQQALQCISQLGFGSARIIKSNLEAEMK